MWHKILSFGLLSYFLFFSVSSVFAANSCWDILTFGSGNTPEWKNNYNLHSVRTCCLDEPATCVKSELDPIKGKLRDYDTVYFCLPKEKAKAADYALQYSKLSKKYPTLHEIGFDDFYVFWGLQLNYDNVELAKIIANTKKNNQNLKFGITVYSNELQALKDLVTVQNRKNIDYVHLYPHFRETDIESDVQKAKKIFPNAKIILGVYAFNFKTRCRESTMVPCDGQEELTLFKDSLVRQAALMANCTAESIEFFPGYFGDEENIGYKRCLEKNNTIEECIASTKKMRADAWKILKAIKPSPTIINRPTPTLTPTIINKCTQCPRLPQAKSKGDANCDGQANVIDYSLWYQEYFKGHQGEDNKKTWSADFTCDGLVNVIDYSLWYRYFH